MVEVRTPGGQLVLGMAPLGPAWELRDPGQPALFVSEADTVVTVKDGAGATVAELRPQADDRHLLLTAGEARYRVTFVQPRRAIHVTDPQGATVIAYEQEEKQAVARDGTTRQVARAYKDGDHIIVVGPAQEPLATVHRMRPIIDRDMAALLLDWSALPPPARAALFVALISR